MNRIPVTGLIALLVFWGTSTRAQAPNEQDPDAPVAVVMSVEDGTCDECPFHQFGQSTRLLVNASLKASDEVRCSSGAYVIATYLHPATFFFMEGTRWNPVGEQGADTSSKDSRTPLKGSLSYNDIMDADRAARAAVAADLDYEKRLSFIVRDWSFAHPAQSDTVLTMAVRQALESSEAVDAADIKVQSKKGAVLLKGNVPQHEQVMKAEDVVQGVPGVKDVKNRLTVYEGPERK